MKKYGVIYYVGSMSLPALSNVQIESALPGVAVTSKDAVGKLNGGDQAVVNLDDQGRPGTHWVAFHVPRTGPNAYYYDSYGAPPPELVLARLKQSRKHVLYNRVQMQTLGSTACGWYCIAWLRAMRGNDSPDSFLGFVDSFKVNNGLANEKRLAALTK